MSYCRPALLASPRQSTWCPAVLWPTAQPGAEPPASSVSEAPSSTPALPQRATAAGALVHAKALGHLPADLAWLAQPLWLASTQVACAPETGRPLHGSLPWLGFTSPNPAEEALSSRGSARVRASGGASAHRRSWGGKARGPRGAARTPPSCIRGGCRCWSDSHQHRQPGRPGRAFGE